MYHFLRTIFSVPFCRRTETSSPSNFRLIEHLWHIAYGEEFTKSD